MTTQASIEQVAGILVREGLSFQAHEDGGGGMLIAAVDRLGDDLQASELRNAVYTLAGTVNEVAGDLEERVGGMRYAELLEDELEELEVEDE